jgi:hypothetical protein
MISSHIWILRDVFNLYLSRLASPLEDCSRDLFWVWRHHLRLLPCPSHPPRRLRPDSPRLHEPDKLVGYLRQHLPSQVEPGHLRVHAGAHKLGEGHELHNVSGRHLAHGRGQADGVAVQLLHRLKVSVTHAHDDDGEREHGRLHNGLKQCNNQGVVSVEQ